MSEDAPRSPEPGHGGFQFTDEKMEPVWTTSVPTTVEEALAYGARIKEYFPGVRLGYVYHREPGSGTYKMLPYKWVGDKFIDIAEALG